MGRGADAAEIVDDAGWKAFLADTLTSRFPDGLTVLDAYGQWRTAQGVIRQERSKVLVILAPQGKEQMRLIAEISDEYNSRFGQEATLQVTSEACVAFR